MKKFSYRYIILLLCICTLAFRSYGQNEPDTSEMSQIGRNFQADGLFFDGIMAKMRDDSAQAKEYFEKYMVKRPEVSDTYYELSKIYYNNKNLEKSEEYIKKAIKLDPGNKWYKEQYAIIYADRANYEEAARILAELSKENPEDRSYPLMAAEYYERARKFNDAITYLDRALMQVGGDDEIMMRKVQVYLSMNDVDKAAGVIIKMLDTDPRNGQLYKTLGEIYDNNKQPDKAMQLFKKAQAVIPDNPYVQIGIAEHFRKTGDTASYMAYIRKVVLNKDLDAETQVGFLSKYIPSLQNDSTAKAQGLPLIQQLVEQHPDDPEVISFYGDLLAYFNNHDSAAIEYKRAVSMKPRDFILWEKLLNEYRTPRDADSLIKYSEKAMHLFPNQAVANYYNGIGRYNKKEYPAAIKAIKRAIDLQPENDTDRLAGMYSALADIYHSSKQDELSDQAFEKALKITPNDATLLNNYSYYLSERGKKLDEAEKMSKRSLDIMPGQATFLDTYGWILYKKGNYQKAKEYIQKAIDQSGNAADGTLYDHLGNVYFKLNDKAKAIENWKISKQKGGGDPLIDKKISEEKLYE